MEVHSKISLALFRIFQESLTNIMRHACATRVEASLTKKDELLHLIVQDNGNGFDPASLKGRKSLGLVGIKERALVMNGSFEITTAPGNGTTLSLSIPLNRIVNP
jgi:signal transduction histidine kinase